MSEHRALDAREVVESLWACEDKQCKDCAIGFEFGCARQLNREAERVIRELQEQLTTAERTRNHERREL